MSQLSLSDIEYSSRKKKTKRDSVLQTLDTLLPWSEWIELIRPFYPEGKRGRPPIAIETILRMYILRTLYKLSDTSVEDAVYDSYAMRSFLQINFFTEQVPDATTLRRFRYLLSKHRLSEQIASDFAAAVKQAGLVLRRGTILEATVISSAPSRKKQ